MLKEQEAGAATADVARKHGISSATFDKFKAKYGGMDVSDARRLKTLEDVAINPERVYAVDARLKKPLAEQRLDNGILKDVAAKMVTPDAKRKAVPHACTVHAVSQRRACLALKIDRSTVRYTSTRPDDALLREAMKAAATERRRFGYRRIHVMLDRQGIVMNQKKLRRLYS